MELGLAEIDYLFMFEIQADKRKCRRNLSQISRVFFFIKSHKLAMYTIRIFECMCINKYIAVPNQKTTVRIEFVLDRRTFIGVSQD